jgi:hypothetical protein
MHVRLSFSIVSHSQSGSGLADSVRAKVVPLEAYAPSVFLENKQFDDLRTEHKRHRALVREQFKEYEQFNQYGVVAISF